MAARRLHLGGAAQQAQLVAGRRGLGPGVGAVEARLQMALREAHVAGRATIGLAGVDVHGAGLELQVQQRGAARRVRRLAAGEAQPAVAAEQQRAAAGGLQADAAAAAGADEAADRQRLARLQRGAAVEEGRRLQAAREQQLIGQRRCGDQSQHPGPQRCAVHHVTSPETAARVANAASIPAGRGASMRRGFQAALRLSLSCPTCLQNLRLTGLPVATRHEWRRRCRPSRRLAAEHSGHRGRHRLGLPDA
ncbi:hypothetical protein [Solimonas variicoloris]|uniref:hypothetical protein n=1 Tax=Solimonas variicoloris TaxID=254408 RepID=UPI0012B65EC2|nr:hypothetical protein [Solimonas variicoloris]